MTFDEILCDWKNSALRAKAAEGTYRAAHASAFVASQQKTADARKAEADAATVAQREARDLAEIEEQACRYRVDHALRRTAPEAA